MSVHDKLANGDMDGLIGGADTGILHIERGHAGRPEGLSREKESAAVDAINEWTFDDGTSYDAVALARKLYIILK